jgi:hypothetical protein
VATTSNNGVGSTPSSAARTAWGQDLSLQKAEQQAIQPGADSLSHRGLVQERGNLSVQRCHVRSAGAGQIHSATSSGSGGGASCAQITWNG